MKKSVRKAIAFVLAVSFAVSLFAGTMAMQGSAASDYSVKLLAENKYSDAVSLGNSFLFFENGTADAVTANTVITYVDADGKSKKFENTLGFTKIQRPVSGETYGANDKKDFNLVARLIKDGKEMLVGPGGKVFGNKYYDHAYYINQNVFLAYEGNNTLILKADGTLIKDLGNEVANYYSIMPTAFIVGDKYLFDATGKAIALPQGYDGNIYFIDENRVGVSKDGLYGVMSVTGSLLIPAAYSSFDSSSYADLGVTEVSILQQDDTYAFNIIDTAGNKKFAEDTKFYIHSYDKYGALIENQETKKFAFYRFSDKTYSIQWGTHDSTSAEQNSVSTQYYYSEGRLIIKKLTMENDQITDIKHQIVDSNNATILALTDKYDAINAYYNDAAVTSVLGADYNDTRYGFLNISGSEIAAPKYRGVDYYGFQSYEYKGTAYKQIVVRGENNKYGILDYSGKEVVAPKYDEIEPITFLNANRWDSWFDRPNTDGGIYIDGIARVNGAGENSGIIDIEGNETVAPGTFKEIKIQSNRLLTVKTSDGKFAVTDNKGNLISEKYDSIGFNYTDMYNPRYDIGSEAIYGVINTSTGFLAITVQGGKYGAVKVDLFVEVSETNTETGISVQADKGVLPADAKLVVDAITTGGSFVLVSTALEGISDKFVTFDIKFLNASNIEIQPNGTVKITMPIPLDFDKDKLALYHIADDGTKTKLEFNFDADKKNIIFDTDHFSLYTLAELKAIVNLPEEPKKPTQTGDDSVSPMLLMAVMLASAAGLIFMVIDGRRRKA